MGMKQLVAAEVLLLEALRVFVETPEALLCL
jgi:hypothetical protein